MANTTNYNWETPDDTDLVKDGAAAIRTLGSSIDTTTKALNPETTLGDIAYRSATANTNTRLAIGTTGQVLTVAAGVPSWATPTTGDIEGVTAGTGITGGGTSGTVTITNSMATAIDAKGDLVVGTGADAFSRLAVGTNTYVLTADSAEATGLKWAAPAAGGSFAGVRVRKSTNQSIANATETVITFDTETFDTDAYHDNSTNSGRLTVPAGKAGYYSIYFCIQWDVNATGDREISLYINGTATRICFANQPGDATLYTAVTGTTTYYLAETDYVQLTAYQDRGGALNVTNSAAVSFGMNKVG
jgi:hypothetical protein